MTPRFELPWRGLGGVVDGLSVRRLKDAQGLGLCWPDARQSGYALRLGTLCGGDEITKKRSEGVGITSCGSGEDAVGGLR